MKILKNIFNRFVNSPYIAGNDFKTNFLLALSFITFVIIAIDLETEMAVERDEISSVVATLEESISTIQLDHSDQNTIKPQPAGLIVLAESSSYNPELYNLPHDRSPPENE
jgi:hypothetical protein